jgi:hypothetical protein
MTSTETSGTADPKFSEQELLEGMATLWERADLLTPLVVRVAATLRLADHIAAGVTTTQGLAEASQSDAACLERVLSYLTTVDVLTEDNGMWSLTAVGEALRDTNPTMARHWLDADLFGGCMDRAMVDLIDTVRTGVPSFDATFGAGFWDHLDANPHLATSFDTLMGGGSGPLAAEVAQEYDWAGVESVVDVGGGQGAFLLGIAEAHQHLRGTVFDLERPVKGAREAIAAAGLSDRLDGAVGSFFDAVPGGADVYTLVSVIHDWGDEQSVQILEQVRAAAGAEGRVLILDGYMDARTPAIAAMDLRMLVLGGGKERTIADYEELVGRAGLRVERSQPLTSWRGGSVLIECRAA